MGLDMYLTARLYISTYDKNNKEKLDAINTAIGNKPDITFNQFIGEAAYWRKSNQIHKWFVDNVQDGRDDCGNYDISREQLSELRDVCRRVLEDRSLAGELLPTQSGFFFGGPEYDDYYFQDLEYTVTRIDKLLCPEYDGIYFEYHSSW
jgi:hypothetical protein